MLITPDQMIALVLPDREIRGLKTDEAELVKTAHETIMSKWETAEQFSLRTPPYSRVLDTLEEDISAATENDFVTLIDSVETVRGTGDELDKVEISLLVAAKNEISKWGEDSDVASKATFSRSKTMLEDRGLIETEKVPIDIGRPRLRLRLATENLQDADLEELAQLAQDQLA